MASTSSIESSDRALKARSANMGETLQTSGGVAKRSHSLLQQKLLQTVDGDSSVAHRSSQPSQRKKHKIQSWRITSSEISTYRCELNSPRYVEYREKQNKHKNAKGESQVWPDLVEEAFHDGMFELLFLVSQTTLINELSALRHIKKNTGRKKRLYNGKDMGTNQLISEFIFQRTGVYRDRKKVSSHLQVLKPFLKENLECKSPWTCARGGRLNF